MRRGKFPVPALQLGCRLLRPRDRDRPVLSGKRRPRHRYSFLRTGVEDGIVTGETADAVMQYMSMVENAKTITEDLDARYEAFADAEAFPH